MPSKKKHIPPKDGSVWSVSSLEATLRGKPKFNGYACGHGPHGDTKYNRAKETRAWKEDMLHSGE